MNKIAALSPQETRYKARAEDYLAKTERILRELAAERRRRSLSRVTDASIVDEVKTILRGK